jgi:hypothetical protein
MIQQVLACAVREEKSWARALLSGCDRGRLCTVHNAVDGPHGIGGRGETDRPTRRDRDASVREAGDGAEIDADASVREAGDGAEIDADASVREAGDGAEIDADASSSRAVEGRF